METINNVAAAASKTIFGDGSDKKEPVSGATGDVSKGEPYDAGNLDPEDQKKFESLPTPGTNPPTPGFNAPPTSGLSGGERAEDAKVADDVQATDDAKVTDDPTAAATTSAEPTPRGDTTAGQTDTKEEPTHTSDHPEETTVPELKGPGPKPVAVLAREHGGDAGQAKNEPTTGADAGAKPDDAAQPEGNKKGSEGTGEKLVHASGLAADGGDFDASNPGAGREADRLLEEKGIVTEGGASKAGGGSDAKSSSSGKKDKPSMSERIKAKFHKK